MRHLIVTLGLTLAVLLGCAGASSGAEPVEGVCLPHEKHQHYPISGQCSSAYESGDYAAALSEWKPRAELGDANAQYNMARLFRWGYGVPEDHEAAVKWYRPAVEQPRCPVRRYC